MSVHSHTCCQWIMFCTDVPAGECPTYTSIRLWRESRNLIKTEIQCCDRIKLWRKWVWTVLWFMYVYMHDSKQTRAECTNVTSKIPLVLPWVGVLAYTYRVDTFYAASSYVTENTGTKLIQVCTELCHGSFQKRDLVPNSFAAKY